MYLLPMLSTLLLGLSFMRYEFGWLVLVGFLPLLFFLDKFQSKPVSKKKALLAVWAAGLVFSLINLSWFLQTQPATWTGINPSSAQTLVVVFWILISAGVSLGWLLFGWLCLRIVKKYPLHSWQALLMLPIAWTIAEYSRSWLFTIITWGNGGSWGAHWNLGNLGFAASATPLVYLSRLLGLFGLSAAVLTISIGLFWLLKRHYKSAAIMLGSFLLLTCLLTLVGRSGNGPELNVGVAQLNDEDALASTATYEQSPKLDLLVLPEYSSPTQFFNSRQALKNKLLKSPRSLVIYVYNNPATNINEIIYEQADGQPVERYHKTLLVPGGEYFFGWASLLLKSTGNRSIIDAYNQQRQRSRGSQKERVVTHNNVAYAALACSGVTSPYYYQKLTNQGAQILTNSASLGVFAKASYFHQQAKQMLRFQAVANARPLLQAARKGYGYIIQPNGDIKATSQQAGNSLLVDSVKTGRSKTPFSRFGELWLKFSLLASAVFIIKWVRIKVSSRPSKPKLSMKRPAKK